MRKLVLVAALVIVAGCSTFASRDDIVLSMPRLEQVEGRAGNLVTLFENDVRRGKVSRDTAMRFREYFNMYFVYRHVAMTYLVQGERAKFDESIALADKELDVMETIILSVLSM